jgi:hypothetical protein
MSLTNHFKLFVLCLGLLGATQHTNAENTNCFGDWIILPTNGLTNQWGFKKSYQPLWNPSSNQVAEAIQRLPTFLEAAQTNGLSGYTNQLPGIRERLPRTGCQFIGVTLEKHKGILLNCFPLSRDPSGDWKKRFVKVYDGGPRWWSVVYLPDEKEFTQLRVDRGF